MPSLLLHDNFKIANKANASLNETLASSAFQPHRHNNIAAKLARERRKYFASLAPAIPQLK